MCYAWWSGKVVLTTQSPRSYVVQTPSGQLRRNRSDIKVVPILAIQDDGQSCASQPTRMMTRTQNGIEIKSPAWYS